MASPYGALWPHPSDTQRSVGLLWSSDQLDAETSTWQHTTFTSSIYVARWEWNHSPSKRAAEDSRLRRRGHWNRHLSNLKCVRQVQAHNSQQTRNRTRFPLTDEPSPLPHNTHHSDGATGVCLLPWAVCTTASTAHALARAHSPSICRK